MKRLLALIFALFTASSAFAAESFPAWKPGFISGGQTASQTLDIGGGSTFSNALQVSGVAAIVVGYDPDRLTAGGTGVTMLYACPDADDANAATRCTALATYTVFTAGEVINITDSYLRTFKSTAPAGVEEAKITIRAVAGSAGGGSGSFSMMSPPLDLSIMGKVSPLFKDAMNESYVRTYNYSPLDRGGNAHVNIDTNTWADINTACTTNIPPNTLLQWASDGNSGCTGGGGTGALCECVCTDTACDVQLALQKTSDYWVDGSAGFYPAGLFNHSVNDWPDPWVSMQAIAPGDCGQMNNAGGFTWPWKVVPGPYFVTQYEMALSDATPAATAEAEATATVAIMGFKTANYDNIALDPLGTTPSTAIIEANIDNGFGILWLGNTKKWYSWFIRSGVMNSYDLADLSVPADFSTYISNRRAIFHAQVFGQVSSGSATQGRAVWMTGFNPFTTAEHNSSSLWRAAIASPTNGMPVQNSEMQPFFGACSFTGAANNAEVFMGRMRLTAIGG